MAGRRASPLDKQTQIRTKIQDDEYDRLEDLARQWGITVYQAVRFAVREMLSKNR